VGGARLERLELRDVRVFADASVTFDTAGTTVLTGPNGSGKTTVLEAVAYLGTERSFRTASRDAMVRTGAARAIVRASLTRDGRPLLVEAELAAGGQTRTLVNRQRVRARAELARAVPATVFSPEDLGIVQGPPARRRALLDDVVRLLDRRAGATIDELERVLRQRAALLRQAAGRLSPGVAETLDVWDERLSSCGEAVAAARSALADAVGAFVADAYARLSGGGAVTLSYRRSWDGGLAAALAAARHDDVRRGASTVGPHHDELDLRLEGRSARLHASQGEQRSLALALRLGTHRLVTTSSGEAPVLLLDDVFSELDGDRSRALVAQLPAGQALLTTAAALPEGIEVSRVLDVRTLGGSG
jgi:DNA replication and repair protein RecF